MARFGFIANGVYNRSDPRCFFPRHIEWKESREEVVEEFSGFVSSGALPFWEFFELIYRARQLRVSGSASYNSGPVQTFNFELTTLSGFSGTTAPVNERGLICGTSATTYKDNTNSDAFTTLTFNFRTAFYDSDEELFYFPFGFSTVDLDSGEGAVTPLVPGSGDVTSSFRMTFLGREIGLYEGPFFPVTGSADIVISEWWEYKNRRGNLPIVGRTTGEKLVSRVPLGTG